MGVKDEQWAAKRARKRPANPQRAAGWQESEFINRELTTEETDAYRVWRNDVENVVIVWTELLENGYRANTKYDDYSSSCAAFLIPGNDDANSGYILTGRGGNAYRALTEALFKHHVIFRGAWINANRLQSRDTDDEF